MRTGERGWRNRLWESHDVSVELRVRPGEASRHNATPQISPRFNKGNDSNLNYSIETKFNLTASLVLLSWNTQSWSWEFTSISCVIEDNVSSHHGHKETDRQTCKQCGIGYRRSEFYKVTSIYQIAHKHSITFFRLKLFSKIASKPIKRCYEYYANDSHSI